MANISLNLLLVLLALINCVAGESDKQGFCLSNPLEECGLHIDEYLIPWNPRQLRKFCKNTEHYFECANDEKYPVDKLCNWPLVLHNAKELIAEFCGDVSPLRTSYWRAAQCFRDHLKRNVNDCYKSTNTVFRMYRKYSKKAKPWIQDTEVVHCIKATHRMECLAIKIKHICGEDAYNTFKVILTTSKFYLLDCKDSSQVGIARSVAEEIYEGLLDNRYPRSEIFL